MTSLPSIVGHRIEAMSETVIPPPIPGHAHAYTEAAVAPPARPWRDVQENPPPVDPWAQLQRHLPRIERKRRYRSWQDVDRPLG